LHERQRGQVCTCVDVRWFTNTVKLLAGLTKPLSVRLYASLSSPFTFTVCIHFIPEYRCSTCCSVFSIQYLLFSYLLEQNMGGNGEGFWPHKSLNSHSLHWSHKKTTDTWKPSWALYQSVDQFCHKTVYHKTRVMKWNHSVYG